MIIDDSAVQLFRHDAEYLFVIRKSARKNPARWQRRFLTTTERI